MATKKTGISPDLLIPPGETIADILQERQITQTELAARTGVSSAYISGVIAGKKNISANFARALEYALDVPKSFWLNLQTHYDAELLEAGEINTITDAEREVRNSLTEIAEHLRKQGQFPMEESKDRSILALRRFFNVSNLTNLKEMIPSGAFRMASHAAVNPYVLGAWIRLCQMNENSGALESRFYPGKIHDLTSEIKEAMRCANQDPQKLLKPIMASYGIGFSVMKNFKGAPVQGYISPGKDGTYQMTLTIRGAYADIFWFSLFHELGHIVNGDVRKTSRFLDNGADVRQEEAADLFASDSLLAPDAYRSFLEKYDFTIGSIISFANSQRVMPYIVIGRLQKEGYLRYSDYSQYKLRYKWDD